jgi:hypothetical protein
MEDDGDELFQRHNSVSTVDFAKEPRRHKLNIIINKTNHLVKYCGQLVLMK